MDITETYIKMCEKAEEIQKLRHLTLGSSGRRFYSAEFMDWWVCQQHRQILEPEHEFRRGAYYSCYNCNAPHIWLPRQDQLQEMATARGGLGIWDLFGQFGDWCREWGGDSGRFCTGEQLWLAFVMVEKYNKVWGGQDWVQDGSGN